MKGKRKIKQCFGFLFCVVITLVSSRVGQADVIWTPPDTFYNQNESKCEYNGRVYAASGPDGSITVWKSPISKIKVATFANDTKLEVFANYTDSKEVVWGLVLNDRNNGWVRMSEFEVVYDNISFMEEHKSEFQDYQGEFDDFAVGDKFILWSYPGSQSINNEMSKQNGDINFSVTYTDPEGRMWGYVGYYYIAKGWICFDDPNNKDLNVSIPGVEPYEAPTVVATPSDSGIWEYTVVLLVIVLILSLVAGTSILIRIIYKKNRSGK